jgi:hypothetical protein
MRYKDIKYFSTNKTPQKNFFLSGKFVVPPARACSPFTQVAQWRYIKDARQMFFCVARARKKNILFTVWLRYWPLKNKKSSLNLLSLCIL